MILPGLVRSALDLQSRLLFHWRSGDGVLTPLTGQAPTFVRAATLSGLTDSLGTSFGVGYNAPSWCAADFDGDALTETLALKVGSTPGYASWPLPVRPTLALTAYAKWIDRRPGSESGRVFDLVWATPLGEFMIGHSGTQAYVASFYDGTTTRSSTSGTVGGAGSVVEAVATLAANGVVQLTTSINGGAAVVASASASLTRPSSTGGAILYTGYPGFVATADIGVLKLAAGALTLQDLREAF